MIGESSSRRGSDDHDWELAVATGAAATLHDQAAALLTAPVRPLIRVSEATSRAVVLGSSQPSSHVDEARLAAAGVELARRRSGGGAVLVGPGEALWVDVVMPAHSPGWDDDVRVAAVWMGRRWVEAVDATGVKGADVWAGGMQRRPWSKQVCFAGVGPGEVLLGGRKLVGVSQRRTRAGALFQCAVL
ncbi:MAG: hypothetical protein J2P57_16420, partial [Acidimicrobiaceae bacterium]|nr:hypothetical protein [Acidimicrobiaceae bacterium]